MGSYGEYAKGEQPMLDRIKEHNDHHNAHRLAIARSAPWWRKLLARIGFKQQFYNWQWRR